jgi:hypothetical protein
MGIFAAIGWAIAGANALFWWLDRSYFLTLLDQKENIKNVWKERCHASVEAIQSRDDAIAHLTMEIEGLTPKRVHGKFASKRDQPEFKKAR